LSIAILFICRRWQGYCSSWLSNWSVL